MTEEESIQWMIDYLGAHPEAPSMDLVKALQAAGLTEADSSRAFNFTQMAWGRLLLEQLGVVLVDWHTCFNAHGEVLSQGKLSDQSQFATATRLAPRYQGSEAFQKLSNESNEVRQTLSALDAGITPEKFGLPPVYMMVETPTEAGLQRAQAYVTSQNDVDNARIDAAAKQRTPQPAATPQDPLPPTPPPPPPPAPKKTAWWKLWH